ncbi:MAG TPA: hypothetical protein VE690_01960, partial [Rhodopila sp.]|nr:hypothetical protein [Rhodopila sp.]
MTRTVPAYAAWLLSLLGIVLLPGLGRGQGSSVQAMKLGYVELEDDPRYANRGEIDGIRFNDLGRPYDASQVALTEARAIGRVTRVDFSMEKTAGRTADDLAQQIRTWTD